MTLLELPHDQHATITAMSVAHQYKERLNAVGICVGNTIKKIHDSGTRPAQPICVATAERSVFALSRTLAAHIQLRIV